MNDTNGQHLLAETGKPTEHDHIDSDLCGMKRAINNLVWMYAPTSTTLAEAEEIACNIQMMIMTGMKDLGASCVVCE
jgi:hypothetical protein